MAKQSTPKAASNSLDDEYEYTKAEYDDEYEYDDEGDYQSIWKKQGERRRKDSGFYGADYSGISNPANTTSLLAGLYTNDGNDSDNEKVYLSEFDNYKVPSSDKVKAAGNPFMPSPPPSPPRNTYTTSLKKFEPSSTHPAKCLPPFTKRVPPFPSLIPKVPSTQAKKSTLQEAAFLILFTCISCIACLIVPPSSIWIRFLYSLGGLYLTIPTVLTMALVWGSLLNSVRDTIGLIVSTKEFMTIMVLSSQTIFGYYGMPMMFIFLDQLRQYDPIGICSLSVWSMLLSGAGAAFMFGTLMLALIAVEFSLLAYRIISPLAQSV